MPLSTFLNERHSPRGLLSLALTDTGMALSRTYTDDSGGGASMTWGTSIPRVQCRVSPVGAERGMIAGRVDERSTHMITVPQNTPVSTDDRFVVLNRGTFEVTAVRKRTREWVRTFEVVALD